MLAPNGGVFGRNPKFNNVTVAGTLTASGSINAAQSITMASGANLVMASGNGISFAATSDPTIPAVRATGYFLRTATNVSDGDTVTVGTAVYTFKTALTPADYEVLIGADAGASLTNLRNAINGTGGVPGTDYQVPAPNASASANAISGSHLPLQAIALGAAGNSVALAETSAQLSRSFATLRGGRDAGGMTSELMSDYEEGLWTPRYSFQSGTPGDITIMVSAGTYTKVGRQVTICGQIYTDVFASGTATGNAYISGLPYTCSSSVRGGISLSRAISFIGPTNVPATGWIEAGTTRIELQIRAASNGNTAALQVGDFAGAFEAHNFLWFTGTYFT